ncbi:MAG TPA: GIY-YIG nuclease family protein [Pseudomonadales bacterium]|nr:GIY-YIG nuclease family protein [Pseudomonadales bacterium]
MDANIVGKWFVYIIRCADGTLYTGITTDLVRREQEHNSEKKGARYTRSRRPVALVYSEEAADRSEASKREYAIKQLPLGGKMALVGAPLAAP